MTDGAEGRRFSGVGWLSSHLSRKLLLALVAIALSASAGLRALLLAMDKLYGLEHPGGEGVAGVAGAVLDHHALV